MKFKLSTLTLLPLMLSLTACGSIPSETGDSAQSNLPIVRFFPIATAVQVDYQDEIQLNRLNNQLMEHTGDNKQKALLFYERGLIHDRMGLAGHSNYDFNQAKNNDPTFADAYNATGVLRLSEGLYDQAFEDFDTAIELSNKIQYSYLHRAIALYQVKRYSLASEDINTFYEMDPADPLRTLWRYIIDSKIDQPKALLTLQAQTADLTQNPSAWGVVDVIAGRTTELEFFNNIGNGVTSNKELAQRLCEGYFYLAQWHKLTGNPALAKYYFQQALATNIHEFIEYKYALIEIRVIERMFQGQVQQ